MLIPTQDYRRTDYVKPAKPLTGWDVWAHGLVGHYHRRSGVFQQLRQQADQIDGLAKNWLRMTDHDLQEQLAGFRDLFRRRPDHPDLPLHDALAAIREAADRQTGLRPFPVQLVGALALHRGYLAEMATGEGKTLVAGVAAVLAGWTGRPCHIITVNDYLVQRDAEWLRPLYSFCGLKPGYVTAAMPPQERRAGYECDVTYTTSKEIVADFLRDRLKLGDWQNASRRLIRTMLAPGAAEREGLVLRGLHTAIVDEADSLLVDEAVTPLIISAPHSNETLRQATRLAQEIVDDIQCGPDYTINLRHREIELTPLGRAKVAVPNASLPPIFRSDNRRLELVRQALTAREFFKLGKQYVVQDGKVVIVDEFTGRLMPMRSWRAGLHQAIEAKENIEITNPTETMARLSFQRFYRMFHKLSGMTGTARETTGEFWQIYKLPVIDIPTNRPCVRRLFPDRIFIDSESKWQAIVADIQELHRSGRPILVGTRNIAASEKLAARLVAKGLKFSLLNALYHFEEAQIVAEAGQHGRITIATNMAGRGTDIKLGQGVAEIGGLHVIATERHEARRIDRQLFGRSARQGDPGSGQAYLSPEDELLQRFVPVALRRRLAQAIGNRFPGVDTMAALTMNLAQKRAEHLAARQRSAVLRMDTWLEDALSFTGGNEI